MKTTTFTIRGITPLIMHNGQLADPLNEHTKALDKLVKNKQKTEKYHLDVAECEFMGSLYVDEDQHPCLPAEVIEAAIVEGAKRMKLGKACKGGINVSENAKLKYDGPKTAKGLWEKNKEFSKRSGVRVGQNRVIRTRPIFQKWECTFDVIWDPDLIKDESQLEDIMNSAGLTGVGDWRPKFGRFEVL